MSETYYIHANGWQEVEGEVREDGVLQTVTGEAHSVGTFKTQKQIDKEKARDEE